MKLPAAAEMQALDKSAIKDFGIPGIVLMENAGLGTVRMMERHLGPCAERFCVIFVGPGNNGGDGLVIGRHLHQRGCRVLFASLVAPDKLKGDAAVNLQIVKKIGLALHVVDTVEAVDSLASLIEQKRISDQPCYAIIDAIFGIGLCRKVERHFAAIIDRINDGAYGHNIPVISVDIPSGMDADTGSILGRCIRADYTATYGWAKPGHFISGRNSRCGKVERIDIGIPPEALEGIDVATRLITAPTLLPHIRPLLRQGDAHKGTQGHLMILAGSPGKTGAAILAAKGALRTGAGLVTLCVPHELNAIYENSLIEAMTIPLPDSSRVLSFASVETISKALKNMQAAIIGPGLGTADETAELVLHLYHNSPCPLVVDADALNILAQNLDKVGAAAGPRILTPHPGELARLLKISTADIQNNRIKAAKDGCGLFAGKQHEIVLALKGAGTIVAGNDGTVSINSSGNPGMATGGMGDVLSGIVGALLCQGMPSGDAATAGVFLHGAAADIMHHRTGSGFTASEVADTIPHALRQVFDGR
ncbi:MAG: NAD(P)H-hydrate dehydratase [Desulforhopalus sp.]